MKKYEAFKNNKLISGLELKTNIKIFPNDEHVREDIINILNKDKKERSNNKENLEKEENLIYQDILNKIEQWKEIAGKINLLNKVSEYEEICDEFNKRPNTENKWEEEKKWYGFDCDISNKVYSLYMRIYEEKDCFKVSYDLCLKGVKETVRIASISNKKLDNEEAAIKYLESRKKYFEKKYFQEDCPPIPKEYASLFGYYGVLIDGCRVE